MNMKIFRLTIFVLLALSVVWLSGCEKIMDMGMTDGIVSPSDSETIPTLKVGLIHPQPNYSGFGKGAELAQAEINAAGGILGMHVKLIYREEKTETVVESARELIEEENVVAILGPLFSSHAVKVGPITTVPVLLGATRAEVTSEETDPNDFLFLVAGSNVLQAKLLAKVVVNQLGAKTAAMIWQNQDVYSGGFVEEFSANFVQLGGSIVAEEVYEPGDTMFDAQLERIKAVNPDVLFLASFPPEVPLIMEQARAMGITATFIGSDGWDVAPLHAMIEDKSLLADSYHCSNFHRTQAVEFVSAFEAMFPGTSAGGVAAGGYDAVRLLAQGIENAQSTDPVAVRDAIANIMDYKGATVISHFKTNDNGQKRESNNSAVVVRGEDGTVYPYPN
jgi:branched-chain amino acid transport system substrate-binding protein